MNLNKIDIEEGTKVDISAEAKSMRILTIYARLLDGKILNKSNLADEFGVTTRSIQRDIESLRAFLSEEMMGRDVVYDAKEKGYRLEQAYCDKLSNSEILAVCKILLESRSMRKDEMMPILEKLLDCCVPESNKKAVKKLIANEQYHYVQPQHNKCILNGLWDIGQAIEQNRIMRIKYKKTRGEIVERTIEPAGLLFSEYYFYLVGFICDADKKNFHNPDDIYPTIYRIDRIQSFIITNEHFTPIYSNRFEEGEFRKRVQFMFGGKLQKTQFKYSGLSVESVLDRLPTAKILSVENGVYTIEAETFGSGIEMWLKSQGEYVR